MNDHIKSLRAKYKAIDDSGDAEIEAKIPLLAQLLIDHAWSQMQDVLDDLMSDLGHPYPGAAARQITDSLANQSQHHPHGQPSQQHAEAWMRHVLGVQRPSGQKNLPNDPTTDARLRQEFNELRDDIIERIQDDLDYPQCWTNYDRDSPPVRQALQRVRAARSPKELLDIIVASEVIMGHYNDMQLCGSTFDMVRELNRLVEQGMTKSLPNDPATNAKLRQRFEAVRAQLRNEMENGADYYHEAAHENDQHINSHYLNYADEAVDFAILVDRCRSPKELINLLHAAAGNPVLYDVFNFDEYEKEMYRLMEQGL